MNEILDFLLQHWQISALLIFVLVAYAGFEYMQSTNSEAISPEEAVLLINHQHGVVIDVRTEAEFNTGHVLNAINIDQSELDAKFVKLNKYKHKPVILMCARGRRSADCLKRFKAHGFQEVFTVTGGINAWQDAGLPITIK